MGQNSQAQYKVMHFGPGQFGCHKQQAWGKYAPVQTKQDHITINSSGHALRRAAEFGVIRLNKLKNILNRSNFRNMLIED